MNMIYKSIHHVYLVMRRHRITFRLTIFLREVGIQGKIKELFTYRSQKKHWIEEAENPDGEMLQTRLFQKNNEKRIKDMMKILADEKSRESWKAAMRFKAWRKPIPKKLYSTHDQYFVKGIIAVDEGEIFVDGGAYVGDTSQQLYDIARKKGIKIGKVIMFEPNPANVRVIRRNFKNENVEIIEKGLYDAETELKFELADKKKGENARVAEGSTEDLSTIFSSLENKEYAVLPVTTLDSHEECRNATFIKMCVEGSEMKAILGAKETILRNRPKLAICIYHNDENMVRIIEYIHSLVPEYKIYVRHHTFSWTQTVMYAVI